MTKEDVLEALQAVKDPEIPTISVVDMGIVTNVSVDGDAIAVTMTPTFVGCPAIDVMRSDIEEVCKGLGFARVSVQVTFDKPWSSNCINARGRQGLLKHGLAPPAEHSGSLGPELEELDHIPCPVCGSSDTKLVSPFGPTLCRSIHKCNSCKETFEAFKPA